MMMRMMVLMMIFMDVACAICDYYITQSNYYHTLSRYDLVTLPP